jgi:hypothetical protein
MSGAANLDIEREILEAVKALEAHYGPESFANPESVFTRTSLGSAPSNRPDFNWRCDRLEQKGQVKIVGRNVGGGFGITLTPQGRERLSMPEDEFRNLHRSISNHTTIHGNVGNLGQTFGSNSPVTQYNQNNPDLSKLFEQLFTAIAEHPTATADQKAEAKIEAQQLQLELKRPSPNPERIKTAIAFLTAYAEPITKLIKHFLPKDWQS